ncbi:MAG: transglutaminase-like domain-containing protein [Cyanobacteria bacterium P01_D01_bin.73]
MPIWVLVGVMISDTEFSAARQQFIQEVRQPESEINLAQAALLIAQEAYPILDIEICLGELGAIADEIRPKLPTERYPLKVLQTINSVLFDEFGFRGNEEDYYDPDNSYLNVVLERRLGIPITLSLVYLDVAARLGFPMVGVGLPGHFVIRPDIEGCELFVDVFNGGDILFPQDCEALLEKIYGEPVPLRPEFFQPVSPKHFLMRLLANLKGIYLSKKLISEALSVVNRMLILFPDDVQQTRDRGLLYYQVGNLKSARWGLEEYLALSPQAEDRALVRRLLAQIDRDSG